MKKNLLCLLAMCFASPAHSLSLGQGPILCHFDTNIYASVSPEGHWSKKNGNVTNAGINLLATKTDGSEVRLILSGTSRLVQTRVSTQRTVTLNGNQALNERGIRCEVSVAPGTTYWCNIQSTGGTCNYCQQKDGKEACYLATGSVRVVPISPIKRAGQ
jgi:hypothetical protein